MVLEQIHRAHHHSGRAKPTLQAVAFFESRLHRVQAAVRRRQTFDGRDIRTRMLRRQGVAGLDSPPIDDDRARAALCRVATHMGAGELELVAQRLHQQRVRRHVQRGLFAVDFELNLHGGCLLA